MQVQAAAPQQPTVPANASGTPPPQGDDAFADLLGMLGGLAAPPAPADPDALKAEAGPVDPAAMMMMAPMPMPLAMAGVAPQTVADSVAATADSVMQALGGAAGKAATLPTPIALMAGGAPVVPQGAPQTQPLAETVPDAPAAVPVGPQARPETSQPQPETLAPDPSTIQSSRLAAPVQPAQVNTAQPSVVVPPSDAQAPTAQQLPALPFAAAVAVVAPQAPTDGPRFDPEALQKLGTAMHQAVHGTSGAPGEQRVQAVEAIQPWDKPAADRKEAAELIPSGNPAVVAPGTPQQGVHVESQARVPLARLPGEMARAAAEEWRNRPEGTTHKTVEIRLDPPSLGSVLIRLTEADGAVHAHVVVQHAAVRDALQTEMGQLAHQLQQQGIALGTVTVGTDSGGQGQNDHRPAETGSDWPYEARGAPSAGGAEPVLVKEVVPIHNGLINFRA